MKGHRARFVSSLAASAALLTVAFLPSPARAQRALDIEMGPWAVPGSDPTLFTAALRRPLLGPFDVSLDGFGVVDGRPLGRSLYGVGPGITANLGGRRLSPYLVAGTGLALAVGQSVDVAAVWSAGAGLELRPFRWLGIRAEARRFVEDRHVRGFWSLRESDRKGWQLSAGISVKWGGGPHGRAGPDRATPTRGPEFPPTPVDVPADADVEALRAEVAETALSMMGEPYRWGGNSAAKGFDCSGLVWYAYRKHGIDVPRVSRSQARAGSPVPTDVVRLLPGDILLFSDDSPRVTHVGMYVGDGRFIHSTNSGVGVSSLDPGAEAFEAWWFDRWVGARRIVGP